MKFQLQNSSKAQCIIKICIVLCAFFVVGSILYYFNYLHAVTGEESKTFNVWYNFLSPIIAIANVVAFIGLTVAIIYGESSRHKQREKIHIADSILNKIYYIEQEFSKAELDLRKNNPSLLDVYSAYIAVYRARNYFQHLLTVSTLGETEKEDVKDMFDVFKELEQQLAASYEQHKAQNIQYTKQDTNTFSQQLNHITGMLNIIEAEMMEQMAKHIEEGISMPIEG